jgi:hypothetical protein
MVVGKFYGRKRLVYELIQSPDYMKKMHPLMSQYLYSEVDSPSLVNNVWVQKMLVQCYELCMVERTNRYFDGLVCELFRA